MKTTVFLFLNERVSLVQLAGLFGIDIEEDI